ncbi:hypothetical protein GCM10010978_05110 [Compostibacillus humi]|uniref:DUF4097 domain-containing protein n=1 Tax=Compostibacillus humi TaxID=1245525 RepID=A0A8J2ZQM9_9BACI|nr:DUF4097 family beta strand repeat-containing protein [Compostibacillus humi]GGH70311.1 hypothetical protein GCM10010978_05110 [Compostibacillus humi]HLT56572.1 DUF4097 family beta strand repeat-containing protein [Bacillota bacterium]
MRNSIKLAIIIIIALVIAVSFSSCQAAKRVKGSEQFSGTISAVEVSSDVAEITILPSDSGKAAVEWDGKISRNRDFNVEEKDGTLSVLLTEKKRMFSWLPFSFFFQTDKGMDIRIFLPEENLDEVTVHNEVGDIEITGVKMKDLQVDTDVAEVIIDGAAADTIEAKSDVGDVTVKNSSGKLSVTTDVGEVNVELEEIEHDHFFQTNVGDVTLTLSAVPDNVTFQATTDVGSVHMFGKKGSYAVKQADYLVEIITDVGDITVSAK